MPIAAFAVTLAVFSVPAGAAAGLAYRLARASKDEWKVLAWVPVTPLAIWAAVMAWGLTRDPTSHNLWPLELVLWGGLSAGLFGIFLLGRRVFGRREDWASRRDRDRQA